MKFEIVEQQAGSAAAGVGKARPRTAGPPRLERTASGHSGVLMELASGLDYLIAQLAKADDDRVEMESERDALRANLETVSARLDEVQNKAGTQQSVIGEQQKALLLSMELMRRLEDEVGSLREKVDAMSAPAVAAPPPVVPNREPELEAAVAERDSRIASLEAKIAELDVELLSARSQIAAQIAAKDLELAQARENLDKLKTEPASNSPGIAEVRALETQRDQARAEAATARADLSIQSAELESKEELIAALERALEQQHGSLRSLEERLGGYSARLQELRMERLTMPGADPAADVEESSGGVLAALKGLFSPPRRARKDAAE